MEASESGRNLLPKIWAILLVLSVGGLCSSSSISDEVFRSSSNVRRLLQAKKSCTVDFEYKNYTIITGKCKGPHYPADVCCEAFKEFACPYSQDINDLNTDCASTMFSYINLNGNYPPGLFANECKEGKLGLDCTAIAPAAASANKSGSGQVTNGPGMSVSVLTASVLAIMFFFYKG